MGDPTDRAQGRLRLGGPAHLVESGFGEEDDRGEALREGVVDVAGDPLPLRRRPGEVMGPGELVLGAPQRPQQLGAVLALPDDPIDPQPHGEARRARDHHLEEDVDGIEASGADADPRRESRGEDDEGDDHFAQSAGEHPDVAEGEEVHEGAVGSQHRGDDEADDDDEDIGAPAVRRRPVGNDEHRVGDDDDGQGGERQQRLGPGDDDGVEDRGAREAEIERQVPPARRGLDDRGTAHGVQVGPRREILCAVHTTELMSHSASI